MTNLNDDMKRILITCAAYPPDIKGGAEKSTQLLAQALSSSGNEVFVLCCASEFGRRMDTDDKTSIISIRSPNIYWNFTGQHSFAAETLWHVLDNYNPRAEQIVEKILCDIKPDVVISSTLVNFGSSVWRSCEKLDIPVIHILRDYYMLCYKSTMFSQGVNCEKPCFKCATFTWGRRSAAKHVAGLVGISEFILDKHKHVFPSAHCSVIPNAVVSPEEIEQRVGNKDVITFGFLGRIEPQKGIAEILDVFRCLPENCHLLVAGTGNPEYEALLKSEFESDRIQFLGWVESSTVYKRIDFAIVPSLWNEPFGRVVIESYAYGVPVIAASRGGLSELVQEGCTGFLYDPDEVDALHGACSKAVESIDIYPQLRCNVREVVRQFSPAIISHRFNEFIGQVISHKRQLPQKNS